jgi:large subunit ribosomal protein L19
MASVIEQIEAKHKKKAVVDVKSGDTVRVHQKIREGGKERIQIFEGLVIRAKRKNSLTSGFTVRRLASGIGVEKTYLIHSPNILKVEIVRRSKVRRNYLTYMRELTGKSARLSGVEFDRDAVNAIHDEEAEAEEAKIHEQNLETHDADAVERAKEEAEVEAQSQAALSSHDDKKTEAEKIEEQPKERAEAKGPATPQNKE